MKYKIKYLAIKYILPILIIGSIAAIYNVLILLTYRPKVITKIRTVKQIIPKIVYKNKQGVILNITYQTLAKDLVNNYNFLSQNQQVKILTAIKKASKDYNINPLVIYSLIATESSFRFWIQSPKRLVVGSDGKKHYDRALGLMSVIWSIHKKALIKNKIITKKSELREIQNNIKAGSFILASMIKKYKGLNTALKHYFGISPYAKIYLKKIQQKVGSLVWFKVE